MNKMYLVFTSTIIMTQAVVAMQESDQYRDDALLAAQLAMEEDCEQYDDAFLAQQIAEYERIQNRRERQQFGDTNSKEYPYPQEAYQQNLSELGTGQDNESAEVDDQTLNFGRDVLMQYKQNVEQFTTLLKAEEFSMLGIGGDPFDLKSPETREGARIHLINEMQKKYGQNINSKQADAIIAKVFCIDKQPT